MYEGKNIHFSPLDNKPLCSYSAKVCKQRRLNGYSLCLRHVLEDPDAPFRQCLYQARNKQQCTNPIHKNNDAQFCTSHLQLLGLLPVGAKSCSKANREGKQVKNGLHNSGSPVQKDQQRSKNKTCDSVACRLAETRSTSGDPYMFLDIDPPKISKSSPPLLSMVADVAGLSSNIAKVCTTDTKPAVLSEPSRSIPISRLYPELVEKLESDGNRLNLSKPKTVRNVRTVNSLQNQTAHSQVKLKESEGSSSSVLPTNGVGDSSALSALMKPPISLSLLSSLPSSSSSAVAADLTLLSNRRTDLTDSQTAIAGSGLCIKNTEINSCNSWMLPIFEPLVAQHAKLQQQQQQSGQPGVQTLSKTFHGLLNTLPLLKSSLQTQFAVGSFPPCSLNYNSSFRSPPESQRLPEKRIVQNQMPSVSLANVQLPHSLDVKTSGTTASGPSSMLPKMNNSLLVSEMTVAASSTLPSATLSAAEMVPEGAKKATDFENSQANSGIKEINFVQPRSRACCILDKEAKRRIGRKRAWKIYLEHASRVVENTNLLPTGVDSSEDDDDDDLDHELPWQRVWNDLSSDEGEGDFDLAEDVASNIRRTKLQLLKSKMRRQFTQLQRCHEGNARVRWRHNVAMGQLIASCREDLSATIEALRSIRNIKSGNSSIPNRSSEACRLQKRPCLHQSDSNVACKSVALPYTNHCIKHIMYNVDQMLFGYCTAKFADKTQCCVPVFDIQHELPLCSDHISKGFGTQESHDQKPKKQRKKTKPSALTRPPKKGKKKKCQRKSAPNPHKMVLGLNECLNSTDMTAVESLVDVVKQPVDGASSSPSVATAAAPILHLTSSSSTISNALLTTDAMSKDSIDDDALGSDLDVTFSPSALPLYTDPASNFLDDHELHEMLNKMADEEFDLSSGKNGGYRSSKEVEEEFVRAFVEVTKTLNDRKEAQLDTMSHDHDGLVTLLRDSAHEDELTKQIADSLLNRNSLSPNGSISDDQDNLGDLTSSLTVHDLKSISQVMQSSMMSHALELCPSAIALQPSNEGHGLLSPLYSHKHPLEMTMTSSSMLPVDQPLVVPVDSRGAVSGLLPYSLTSHSSVVENSTASQLPLRIVTSVSLSPSLPSLLSTMLPMTVGATSSHGIVGMDSAIVSRTMRPAPASDDGLPRPFQTLPDIQTLMRQPWRLGDEHQILELQSNSVTLSSLAAAVSFHGNPFSYLPNFNPQLLANESKVGCTLLSKTELENVESVLRPVTEASAAAVLEAHDSSSGACSQSSLQKILDQKPAI